jgi:hypothetical protein
VVDWWFTITNVSGQNTAFVELGNFSFRLFGRALSVSVSGDLSVGVCIKEQPYALVDAEAGVFLIYSLF